MMTDKKEEEFQQVLILTAVNDILRTFSLHVFIDYNIDRKSCSLILFFSAKWNG
jgi:hypothetical protein